MAHKRVDNPKSHVNRQSPAKPTPTAIPTAIPTTNHTRHVEHRKQHQPGSKQHQRAEVQQNTVTVAEEALGVVIDADPEKRRTGVVDMTYKGVVTINGKQNKGEKRKVTVLIDSGASRNMISTRLAKDMVQIQTGSNSVRFCFANGTYFLSDKRCPQVELQIQRYRTSLDMLVCELQHVDIILGREWLTTNKPDIDWATGAVMLEGVPVEASVAAAEDKPVAVKDVQMVSAGQLRRMLRSGAQEEWETGVFFVSEVGVSDEVVQAVEAAGLPPGVVGATPVGVAQAVQQHAEVFAKPQGLPPSRERSTISALY
jgi:hypothetical protein